MHHHEEHKKIPYSAKQIFDLVADINAYHEFLPWCLASRITNKSQTNQESIILADLMIGYKMIREKFTSKVRLNPYREIHVENKGGPFKFMENIWHFKELENGNCEIYFKVTFEFKSAMLDKIMGLFFDDAVKKMISAFENRAKDLYANKSSPYTLS